VKSLFTNHRTTVILILISLTALCVRLPGLELRPFHGDEANQAYKTGHDLLEEGTYVYDPDDHHGPTLYYLTLIPLHLAGQTTFIETRDWAYRTVPVFFGAALIFLMVLLRPAMSASMLVVSGLLVCLSPAFVFYSRYYIQEMLLVFFSLAAIGFGYRYFIKPSTGLALCTGASLSLMHATKETAIIAYASIFTGLVILGVMYRNDDHVMQTRSEMKLKHLYAGLGIAVALNILLFTAFFTHAAGPLDSIYTYGNYIKRADGFGLHDKPWEYYLRILAYDKRGPQYWFSEGFALLGGGIGIITLFVQLIRKNKPSPLFIFLTVYTVCMITVYSLIPYKTPWTMLSFYHGIILLAGYAFGQLYSQTKTTAIRCVWAVLFAIGLGHFGYQAYIQNVEIPTDTRNPYVYAHTSSASLKMIDRAHQIKAIHPDPENMVIMVVQPDGDYWPLPYYLRDISHIGFYPTIPKNLDMADMIIADPRTREHLAEVIKDDYTKEMGGLRPSVLRHIYIKRDLWDAYLETLNEG